MCPGTHCFFSNLAIMAKFGKLMTESDCDVIKRVQAIKKRDGGKASIIKEWTTELRTFLYVVTGTENHRVI